jgi:hypothetical protein
MLELGYALSSEEHSPTELVNFAQQAEAVGFNFCHALGSRPGSART